MKRLFILIVFFSAHCCLNGQQRKPAGQREMLFQYVDSSGKKDFIKLFFEKGSVVRGIYLGTFQQAKAGTIYYKSRFVTWNAEPNYSIAFDLKRLVFSEYAFDFSAESTRKTFLMDSTQSLQAQFFFSSRIAFFGNLDGDRLDLQRTSAKNIANSADRMIFTRIKSK